LSAPAEVLTSTSATRLRSYSALSIPT
jgi:hypothetical protein